MNLSAQPADPLADCAQEPIRIPGAIQPHGALMLVREADLIVLQSSENLAATLKLPLAADADRSVGKMLGERLEGDLRQWLGSDDPLYLKQHEIAGNPLASPATAPGRASSWNSKRAEAARRRTALTRCCDALWSSPIRSPRSMPFARWRRGTSRR